MIWIESTVSGLMRFKTKSICKLSFAYCPLESLVIRVLASSAGGPGFNPKSRTVSYQRHYKNGTNSSLVQHSTFNGKYWLLWQGWKKNSNAKKVLRKCCGQMVPLWQTSMISKNIQTFILPRTNIGYQHV